MVLLDDVKSPLTTSHNKFGPWEEEGDTSNSSIPSEGEENLFTDHIHKINLATGEEIIRLTRSKFKQCLPTGGDKKRKIIPLVGGEAEGEEGQRSKVGGGEYTHMEYSRV